jgi:hypothetical protein
VIRPRSKPRRWSKTGNLPATYTLRQGGVELAKVQHGSGGYFWYTLATERPNNTAHRPTDSVNKAKAEALAFIEEQDSRKG